MKLRGVVRPELAVGFELAGLRVARVDRPGAAAETVGALASDRDLGVLIMDDEVYRMLPRELTARIDRAALPILAPVPGPAWDERRTAEAYVMEILRQAIGYRVRPR